MHLVKPITFLLAEDNDDHAELIVESLEVYRVGNKVIRVDNGEALLRYLDELGPDSADQSLPDVILLDIKMPRMNGIEVLTELKNNPKYKHIPVVMISTSRTDNDVKACYQIGANSYLTKPLKFNEFSQKMRDLNLYWVLTSELPGKSL